jgi:hypothetical protein
MHLVCLLLIFSVTVTYRASQFKITRQQQQPLFRGGQSGAGAGFLQVLWFPLLIFIPPIAPQSPSSIIWGLYNRPEVAAVPRDLVPPHKKKNQPLSE